MISQNDMPESLMLESFFDKAAFGLAVADIDGKILRSNKALRDMLGCGQDEICGNRLDRFVYADDVTKDASLYQQLIHSEIDSYKVDKRFVRKDLEVFWGQLSVSFVGGVNGGSSYAVHILGDISGEKQKDFMFNFLLKLIQMHGKSEEEIRSFALEECVRLTNSMVGYMHFVGEDEKSISLSLWSKDTLRRCTAEKTEHYPLEKAGIWADSIRLRKPVMHNDYQGEARKKGYPQGHFPIYRHLSVPIEEDGRIVAVAGVGNKRSPYTEADAVCLSQLLNIMWGILKRKLIGKKLIATEQENLALKAAVSSVTHNRKIVGRSPAIKRIIEKIEKISPLMSNVLITGESGVGKGLMARTMHRLSKCSSGPFVTINCAAMPRDLVEAELFGHEKGAFTGAISRRLGKIEVANGGTLFLDEIGDMPLDLQAKLLNFLQERVFHRIGGNENVYSDVRIIAATNQDLESLIEEKRFRRDLFYRLHVVPLYIQPLRERREDIPLLVEHILECIAQSRGTGIYFVDDDAMRMLVEYSWPGNVREMQNVLEHTSIVSEDNIIRPSDLEVDLNGRPSLAALTNGGTLAEIEERAIREALERSGGNREEAARALGISVRSIYNKIKRLNLP